MDNSKVHCPVKKTIDPMLPPGPFCIIGSVHSVHDERAQRLNQLYVQVIERAHTRQDVHDLRSEFPH